MMISLILVLAIVILIVTVMLYLKRASEQYAIGYKPSTRGQEYDYNKPSNSSMNAEIFQQSTGGDFSFSAPNWPF